MLKSHNFKIFGIERFFDICCFIKVFLIYSVYKPAVQTLFVQQGHKNICKMIVYINLILQMYIKIHLFTARGGCTWILLKFQISLALIFRKYSD